MNEQERDPSAPRCVRVLIHGRVQGVGFRFATAARAEENGLGGWVRNREDGGVEAVFVGPAQAVERMIEWCRRGPPSARVSELDVIDEPAGGDDSAVFEIRH